MAASRTVMNMSTNCVRRSCCNDRDHRRQGSQLQRQLNDDPLLVLCISPCCAHPLIANLDVVRGAAKLIHYSESSSIRPTYDSSYGNGLSAGQYPASLLATVSRSRHSIVASTSTGRAPSIVSPASVTASIAS